jgi:bacillithiol biosynthesis cysteine-adding enzyme BshC
LPASNGIDNAAAVTAVPYDRLPGFSKVWQSVILDDPLVDKLYARLPADADACARAAEEQLAAPRDWKRLADILRAEGELYGVPKQTLARLDLLEAGKAVAVVTGQQVGFLGGPFYTLLKAYHCTRLARALEASLNRPVLPIFWLEGEDHDLPEVSKSVYPSVSGELCELNFTPRNIIPNYEVGRYEIPLESLAQVHELASAMQSADAEGAELVERSYMETTLSGGMGRLLAATFGERGLLIVEGMHPGLKQMAEPLWNRVIDAGPRLTQLLTSRSVELEQIQLPAPLKPTAGNYLFYVTGKEHRRQPLAYDGTLTRSDGSTEKLSADQLKDRVHSGELTISPKAALRPLYQDFVLPTVAYVAGPTELEYHAQLSLFYRELNVVAPSLFPRFTATLTDGKSARLLTKLSLTPERLLSTTAHELKKSLLHEADEGRTAALFDRGKSRIESVFAEIKTELAKLDPTLEAAANSAAGKGLQPLEQLRKKVEKSLRQQHSTTLERLDKLLAAVKPNGAPSERIFGTAYYLMKYGPHRLLDILDCAPADGKAHSFIIAD